MLIANKYRPQRFSEVIGQDASVRIMTNSILMNRVSKAILISGIHGTGKTTLARLYAKAVNCEKFIELSDTCNKCPSCLDIENQSNDSLLEIDAASNNSVDNIRNLERVVLQVPLHKYLVVILDECHMLSTSAQNAFLKILEEPPDRVIFMLITTNSEKLLPTIRSRCLSMPLRSLSISNVAKGIDRVIQSEGKATKGHFVDSLAINCNGSMRDAYQMLEQLFISSGNEPLDVKMLEEAVGIISKDQFMDLAAVLCAKNSGQEAGLRFAFEEIERWYREGFDLRYIFIEGIPIITRDFMIYLSGCYSDRIEYLSGISNKAFNDNLNLSIKDLNIFIKEWDITEKIMRITSNSKVVWQMYIIKTFISE